MGTSLDWRRRKQGKELLLLLSKRLQGYLQMTEITIRKVANGYVVRLPQNVSSMLSGEEPIEYVINTLEQLYEFLKEKMGWV